MNRSHGFRRGALMACLGALLLLQPVLSSANPRLGGEIDQYIKSLRGKGVIARNERTSWLVFDLTSGNRLASINENTSLQAASMIKPYLMLAFFHQVKAGKLSYGATSKRHMERMIQVSDNDSTNWVMRQVGGPAATQQILKQHYPSLSHHVSIVEYIPAGGRTYRNRASAGDYGRFLAAMWHKQLPQSSEMLRIMGLPGNNRLYTKVPSIPSGTAVYNKTGSTAMCCGDMGILVARGRDGRSYPYIVIGVIESSQRNNASYSTWITRRANVIRHVSGLAYTEMKRHHRL